MTTEVKVPVFFKNSSTITDPLYAEGNNILYALSEIGGRARTTANQFMKRCTFESSFLQQRAKDYYVGPQVSPVIYSNGQNSFDGVALTKRNGALFDSSSLSTTCNAQNISMDGLDPIAKYAHKIQGTYREYNRPTQSMYWNVTNATSKLSQQFSFDDLPVVRNAIVEQPKLQAKFVFTRRPRFGYYKVTKPFDYSKCLHRVVVCGIALFAIYIGLSVLLQWLLNRKRRTHVLQEDYPENHPIDILDVMAAKPGNYGYNVGDYFVVCNYHEWNCKDGTKCTTITNGFVTSTGNKYYYPTLQYYELQYADIAFSVYKVCGSIFEQNLKAIYSNSLFKRPTTLFRALYDWATLDETQFSHHEQHYKWLKRREGHVVSFSIDKTIAHHIDYDSNKITVIPLSVYSRIHNQARSCYTGSTLQQRVRSAINTMITAKNLETDPQVTNALIDIYTQMNDEYNMYSKTPRVYHFIYDLPTKVFRRKLVVHEFERPCFRTDLYKPQKPFSSVSISCDTCITKQQNWYSYGNSFAKDNITYPKNCPCNGMRAIKNRSNCDLGNIHRETIKEFSAYWRNNISSIIDVDHYESMDDKTWINSLQSIKKSLKMEGLKQNEINGIVDEHDTSVKAFIKMEPANMKEKHVPVQCQQIDPRVISGRFETYDSRAGARVKRVSKLLSSIWSYTENQQVEGQYRRIPSITYFSTGHNRITIGKWFDAVQDWYLYNTDYSRFDASTSIPLQMLEHDIIFSLVNDPEIIKWLNVQLITCGKMKWMDKNEIITLIYKTLGTRKSGDQNTSLGNTIINVLVQLWAIARVHNKSAVTLVLNDQIRFLVLGDDTVIASKFLINLHSYVQKVRLLGLTIDIARKSKYTVTFCSSYFVPAVVNGEETHILTQKPGRNLTRAYTSHIKHENYESWVKTNAFAFLNDYRHIPFMYHWHKQIHDSVSDAPALKIQDLPEFNSEIHDYKHCPSNYTVTPSQRLYDWMEHVYGFRDVNFRLKDFFGYPTSETSSIIDCDVYKPLVTHDEEVASLPKDFKVDTPPINFRVPISHLPTNQEYQSTTDNFIPKWEFRDPFLFEVTKNGNFINIREQHGPLPHVDNKYDGDDDNNDDNKSNKSDSDDDDDESSSTDSDDDDDDDINSKIYYTKYMKPHPYLMKFKKPFDVSKLTLLNKEKVAGILGVPRKPPLMPRVVNLPSPIQELCEVLKQDPPSPKVCSIKPPKIIHPQTSTSSDEKEEKSDVIITVNAPSPKGRHVVDPVAERQKAFDEYVATFGAAISNYFKGLNTRDKKVASHIDQAFAQEYESKGKYVEPVVTGFGYPLDEPMALDIIWSNHRSKTKYAKSIWGPNKGTSEYNVQMSGVISMAVETAKSFFTKTIIFVNFDKDIIAAHMKIVNDYMVAQTDDKSLLYNFITCKHTEINMLSHISDAVCVINDTHHEHSIDRVLDITNSSHCTLLVRPNIVNLCGDTGVCRWESTKQDGSVTLKYVTPHDERTFTNYKQENHAVHQVYIHTDSRGFTHGVIVSNISSLPDFFIFKFVNPDEIVLAGNNTLPLDQ